MTVTLPAKLDGLSTREQITDVLYRATWAIDRNDKALWDTVWAEGDDIFIAIGDRKSQGKEAVDQSLKTVGPLDTHHTTTGIRIDVKEGASTARLTANAQNMHYPAGQGMSGSQRYFLAASTYDCTFVKQNDSWKLKGWQIDVAWAQGDPSVMNASE